jgi:hypothetical protein
MSGRRFDVTAIQAVSSMLAALTGAVAASSLGIAGTMIGAGLMSLASTVGAAIYKHYIASGNERLRAAAATLAPVLDPAGAHRGSGHRDGDHATPIQESARPRPRARTLPVSGGTARPGDAPDPDGPEPPAPPAGGKTVAQVLASADRDTVDLPPAEPGGPDDTHAIGDAEPGPRGPRWSRRRWLALAGTALGVFVIVMGAVTAFEAIAGKPLEAVVWHKHASGTTIGGLVGGGQQHAPPPRHSPSPTGSPGPSTTPPASTSPSSAPGSSSPAPSGSASPSGPASPSPGTSPPAGPTSQSPSALPAGGSAQPPAG